MIGIFDIASNDQSVAYLGQLFGMVGNVLNADTNVTPILGMMFRFISTMALTVGAGLVVYVTVVGLIATAHEGEFMGKKWSGLWVPLRTVFGIAALFPTPTGYSAIQVVFMWVILQGVGAADTLWSSVLKFTSVSGSIYASANLASGEGGTASGGVNGVVRAIFQGMVCQYTAYQRNEIKSSGKNLYYCKQNETTPFCQRSKESLANFNQFNEVKGNKFEMGPYASCGTLVYCNQETSCAGDKANSIGCTACKVQKKTLATIMPTLAGAGEVFAQLDSDYLKFYFSFQSAGTAPEWIKNYCTAQGLTNDCCGLFSNQGFNIRCALSNLSPTKGKQMTNVDAKTIARLYKPYGVDRVFNGIDFITATTTAYNTAITTEVQKYIKEKMDQRDFVYSDEWMQEAQKLGWIMAGGYYYNLAKKTDNNMKEAIPAFGVESPQFDDSNELSKFRNNYAAAAELASSINQNADDALGGAQAPAMKDVNEALTGATGSLLKDFMGYISASYGGATNNPLISMPNFGYTLLAMAQTTYVVLSALIFGMTTLATVNPMVFGSGLTMSPWGEGLKALWNFIGPLMMILIGAMFTLGATLAIYVPLIPFIVFSMGALGWLIATIEAMVAAPLVALGILSPGGQHEILGRAEPAIMLLFNLFLRPTLMIFGLITSILLAVVVMNMINAGFLTFLQGNVIQHPGLAEQLLFLSAYTTLVVTVMNKVFTLIYVIPERVLTWIGGQAVSYGEGEALGQVKHGIEGAAGAGASAGKEATGSAMASGTAMRAAQKAEDRRAKDGKFADDSKGG